MFFRSVQIQINAAKYPDLKNTKYVKLVSSPFRFQTYSNEQEEMAPTISAFWGTRYKLVSCILWWRQTRCLAGCIRHVISFSFSLSRVWNHWSEAIWACKQNKLPG